MMAAAAPERNFLKIEEGVSPTVSDEHRNPSSRSYLGTNRRWMWGLVVALCCIFPVAALLRSHTQATVNQHAGNIAGVSQLSQPSSLIGQAFIAARAPSQAVSPLHAYVPSGMSKEQWAKVQKKEADAKKTKKFGLGGARGFESRSMQSFQEARERGEADHLFPVNPADVASGKIALKDVPYMQRGGSWKNSDLKGKKGWMTTGFGMRAYNDGKAAKMKENQYDKKYNNLKPNIGVFDGVALDWTGKGSQDKTQNTVANRAAKNGISQDQQMWRDSGALSDREIRAMNQKRRGAPKINSGEAKEKAGGFFGWR
jgi:hypothetical protein